MIRSKFLSKYAAKLGASWACSLSEALLQEKRLVAGGFPGTLPEARGRVAHLLGAELARLELTPLRPEEASNAVGLVYARAQRDWRGLSRSRQRRES